MTDASASAPQEAAAQATDDAVQRPSLPGDAGNAAAQAPDGNATLVGSFLSPLPGIAESLACLRRRDSSVTDRGRPVQLRELIFDWLSPNQDFGQIRFIASLVSSKN